MTVADPYPEILAEIDEAPINVNQDAVTNRLIAAVNRLAQAIEQDTLARLHPVVAPQGVLTLNPLPPVTAGENVTHAAPINVCPIHGTPWKTVPAGVSKKTGKPYDSFVACSTAGCDQRPPR